MKSFVTLLAALLLAPAATLAPPCAHAATFSKQQLCMVLQPCEPPAKFASGPFLAKPVIREVSLRDIQRICGAGSAHAAANGDIMGCARLEPTECIVHVPKDVKAAVPELYDVVLRHELAHCRGWVHADY